MRRSFFMLCLLLGLCAGITDAQDAALSGIVTDSSGGAVPKASVQVQNQNTGIKLQTQTNGQGIYSFPFLKPGPYEITVQANGFKTVNQTGITLAVAQTARIDFSLQVGSVAETVTVSGGAPLVNTQDASVSTVVDRNFAENLPMNGRSFQTLIALTPGVVLTPTSLADQGQFSVNGQRADANYLTIDGASANAGISAGTGLVQSAGGALPAFSAFGGTNSLVSIDAMQEFRVQTSTFAPEFGRTPGGQVSVVTRSGSNSFHGSLFEYLRNDALDANNWFNGFTNNPPIPKAKERQNDFGGVVGGPIVKDRTFFFLSYEGLRLRLPQTQTTVVPSVAARQTAPTAVQPFLNAFPVPNGATLANGLAQFSASYSNPATLDSYSVRFDQAINRRLTVFGRYNYSPSEIETRNTSSLAYVSPTRFTTHTLTIGVTGTLSNNISNDFRANYSNNHGKLVSRPDSFGGAVSFSDSSAFPAGYSSATSQFGVVILGAGSGSGNAGIVTGISANSENRQLNFVDNLSVVADTHELKFGVDYRWLSPISGLPPYIQSIVFNGVSGGTGSASSGRTLAATITAQQIVTLLSHNVSLYSQDSWKINPRLSLTYGLRWDINPPLRGKSSTDDPLTVMGLENPATLTLAPAGTKLYETTYGNVAPRLGVAYQLNQSQRWQSVIRGGVGVFYDLGYGLLGSLTSGFPFTASKSLGSVQLPLTSEQAAAPLISAALPESASSFLVADQHLKLPRTYQWNAALEQALGSSQAISLTYVGAIGRDLLRQDTLRSPNSNFLSIAVTRNTATSDYHALQFKYERRLSHGLQALGSYSWSHSIDIASSDAVGNTTPIAVSSANIDRGSSSFDVRHSVSGVLSYDVPFRHESKLAHAILSNWSVESLFMARSALPVDVIGATFVFSGTQYTARPNVIPGVPLYLYGSQYPGGKAFNKAALTAPVSGQQGTLGRNVFRGFGMWQENFAIRRQFHVMERVGLQFRAEFFNIFNHPNFGRPVNSFTNPLFGQSNTALGSDLGSGGATGGLTPLYQVGSPRSVQFALKLTF